MMRVRTIPAAALLAAGLLLAQQVKMQDSVQFERGLGNASKEIGRENPNLKFNVTKDSKAIRDAYNVMDQIGQSWTILSPDDSLKQTWKALRTGDDSIPKKFNFGADEFLRYGLAMQNANGQLTDSDYVVVSGKLLERQKALAPATLEADQNVVLGALPELRKHYEAAGFNKVEANEAAVSTWYQVRVGQKAVAQYSRITEVDLLGRRMGRLVVISDPLEAAVNVNGHPWQDPTRVSEFIEAGSVVIVLSKTGYETLTEVIKVEPDKSNEFKRTLKKKP